MQSTQLGAEEQRCQLRPGCALPRHFSITQCLNKHCFFPEILHCPILTPFPLKSPKEKQQRGTEGFRSAGGSRGVPPHRCPSPCPHARPVSLPPLPAPTCNVFAGNYFLQSVCHSRAINILPQFGLSFSLMIYLKKMIPQAKHFSVIITHGK